MEKISYDTEDGVEIFGDYFAVEEPKAFALLLHMMPATKESWQAFAAELQNRGIASLAIDERGHGESTMDGALLYANFTDEDQQNKIIDVRDGLKWLANNHGATDANTVVVGGSIGANLTIQILSERHDLKLGVALSPGLDYRGIKTDELIKNIADDQMLLLIASDDDKGSFDSIQTLAGLKPDQCELVKESGIGHATAMLEKKLELVKDIADWIESKM
ncbi:MAG: alpha/beta hydrolase [Candidatus Uhrbacteria bacterium]|nr:alpha/beta hydrolase [Patescibacteria group bacterium]MBU1907112.1 alpha/beta hydrolase [Patescibacteria group bacterium]